MSDKNLDELLSGLKQDYERMPEQVDKQTIMQRVFRKKRRPRFGKAMPLVAIVAGLFLFALVSLPYVKDYDQADYNPSYLEMYYLNALDDFKESLGLEEVEEFIMVSEAEWIVDNYGSSGGSQDYETAREDIDDLLTTPKKIVEEAQKEKEFFADDEQFNRIMDFMHSSLQNYLSDLLVGYGIERKDQDAILDARGNPESYQGPHEIRNFLVVLEEQGYTVIRQEGADRLRVGLDFSWQLEQSDGLAGSEGYMHYLELMTTITDKDNEIPREKMDSILLEIEYIYDAYPGEREAIFENSFLLGEAGQYLKKYLALSLDDGEIDQEVMLDEYYSFLKTHEDSRFWEIVKARVDTIEMESTDYLNFNVGSLELRLLFNEQFEGITFSDIINLNYDDRYRAQDIQQSYVEYSETKDGKVLENLDGAKMTLLYKYAFERSEAELYSPLYAEDSQWSSYGEEELHEALVEEGWMDVFAQSSHAVIQDESEKLTVTFIYITQVSAQMEWVKEDGVWKLLDQSVESIP